MRVLLTSVVGGALVWKLLRARNRAAGPESLKELDTFIQEEVLAKGEQTVLLGRFSWQPEGSRALVKLSQRPMSISCALRSLGLKLVSYSGAEYCYYDAAVQLTSLVITGLVITGARVVVLLLSLIVLLLPLIVLLLSLIILLLPLIVLLLPPIPAALGVTRIC